jgi:hypothetical protein
LSDELQNHRNWHLALGIWPVGRMPGYFLVLLIAECQMFAEVLCRN